jgi:hypothetical protein
MVGGEKNSSANIDRALEAMVRLTKGTRTNQRRRLAHLGTYHGWGRDRDGVWCHLAAHKEEKKRNKMTRGILLP